MECLDCGQQFDSRYYVKKHYRETDCSGEVCRFCGRDDFLSKKGKKQHEAKSHDRPYKDEDVLRKLYIDREMGINQIANRFDVADKTIQDWLEKHGIETRDWGESIKRNKANFVISDHGYERWRAMSDGKYQSVAVHRLLAVAQYGFDNVKGKVVHHKNGVKWDNRPQNIEIMTESEHKSLHGCPGEEDHWNSKLTNEDVEEIRQLYESGGVLQSELAEKYDVARTTIQNVVNGDTWSN